MSELELLKLNSPPQIQIKDTGLNKKLEAKDDIPQVSVIGTDTFNNSCTLKGIPAVKSLNLDQEEKARLLGDVFSKLSEHANNNKNLFKEEFNIIQKLANGVNYELLSSNEKATLNTLGLNASNINKQIANELLTLIKPFNNQTQTKEFKEITTQTNQVSRTLQNGIKTIGTIGKKLEEIEKLQNISKDFGAKKVSSILVQVQNNPNIKPVNKIVLTKPEDIIARNLIINAVKKPNDFTLIKDAIERAKKNEEIDNTSIKLLQNVGLKVDKKNNQIVIKDISGKALESSKLESISNTMHILADPTPEAKLILEAGARYLEQNTVVRELTAEVKTGTRKLDQSERELRKAIQDIDRALEYKFKLSKAYTTILELHKKTTLTEEELNNLRIFNISVRFEGNKVKLYRDNKVVSIEELKKDLEEERKKQEILLKSLEEKLVHLKTRTNIELQDLQQKRKKLEEEEKKLEQLKQEYEKVKQQNIDKVKPEERAYIDNELEPYIQKVHKETSEQAKQTIKEAIELENKVLNTLDKTDKLLNSLNVQKDVQDKTEHKENKKTELKYEDQIVENNKEKIDTSYNKIGFVEQASNDKSYNKDNYLDLIITQNVQNEIDKMQEEQKKYFLNKKELEEFEKEIKEKELIYKRSREIKQAQRESIKLDIEQKIQNKVYDKVDRQRKEFLELQDKIKSKKFKIST